MTQEIKTPFGTTLRHCVDSLLLKKNKALTLEYWTSKEYHLHCRINERARMQSQYRAKAGFIAGMLINALLYRISDHADQLLIRR